MRLNVDVGGQHAISFQTLPTTATVEELRDSVLNHISREKRFSVPGSGAALLLHNGTPLICVGGSTSDEREPAMLVDCGVADGDTVALCFATDIGESLEVCAGSLGTLCYQLECLGELYGRTKQSLVNNNKRVWLKQFPSEESELSVSLASEALKSLNEAEKLLAVLSRVFFCCSPLSCGMKPARTSRVFLNNVAELPQGSHACFTHSDLDSGGRMIAQFFMCALSDPKGAAIGAVLTDAMSTALRQQLTHMGVDSAELEKSGRLLQMHSKEIYSTMKTCENRLETLLAAIDQLASKGYGSIYLVGAVESPQQQEGEWYEKWMHEFLDYEDAVCQTIAERPNICLRVLCTYHRVSTPRTLLYHAESLHPVIVC